MKSDRFYVMNKPLFILLFLLISSNHADVMYELETRTGGAMGIGEGCTIVRNFVKGDCMRTELKTENPLLGETEGFTITRMDKGVIWLFDQGRKKYSEVLLNCDSTTESSTGTNYPLPEISIVKTEEKKEVLKVTCEKYVISMKIKSQDDDLEIIQTMWMGKDFPGYDEIMEFNRKMRGNTKQLNIAGIDDGIIREFAKKISEIEGFPLEMELDINLQNQGADLVLKTRSVVRKISSVPISNKVFEIPEGYQLDSSLNSN